MSNAKKRKKAKQFRTLLSSHSNWLNAFLFKLVDSPSQVFMHNYAYVLMRIVAPKTSFPPPPANIDFPKHTNCVSTGKASMKAHYICMVITIMPTLVCRIMINWWWGKPKAPSLNAKLLRAFKVCTPKVVIWGLNCDSLIDNPVSVTHAVIRHYLSENLTKS